MPRGLWLPECYATPALTGIGRRLIRRALDYIIQVQDEHFHVYFREYPLFTKGSFFLSLMLLFLELTWRTSQRKWISRWDIICLERLYEEDSIRQSSGQNDAAATAQTRSREKKTLEMLRSPQQSSSVRIPPTREIHFFNRFSVFCFFVVSRLSSNTLRERPGLPRGRHRWIKFRAMKEWKGQESAKCLWGRK